MKHPVTLIRTVVVALVTLLFVFAVPSVALAGTLQGGSEGCVIEYTGTGGKGSTYRVKTPGKNPSACRNEARNMQEAAQRDPNPAAAQLAQPNPSAVCQPGQPSAQCPSIQGPGAVPNPDNDPLTDQKPQDTSVIGYINAGYAYAAGIGGLLAVMMLVWAGYRYMTSYGDPEKISDAKDIVEKSLLGLGLLILAAVILNTLNPRIIDEPCKPGQPGCGDIDFSDPKGGTTNTGGTPRSNTP